MVQFIWIIYDWMHKRTSRSNIAAVRDSLITIRKICSDALERKTAINTEAGQQWVRQLQIDIYDAQLRLEDFIGNYRPRKQP